MTILALILLSIPASFFVMIVFGDFSGRNMKGDEILKVWFMLFILISSLLVGIYLLQGLR